MASGAKKQERIAGELETKPLEGLLVFLNQGQKNGILSLQQGPSQSKDFYFIKGLLVFAHSSIPSEQFPEYLATQGSITAEQKAELNALNEEAAGLSLIAPELKPLPKLKEHLHQYSINLLKNMFQWRKGSFEFKPLNGSSSKINIEGIAPEGIIYEGIKLHYDVERLAPKFEKIQARRLVLTPEFQKKMQQIPFVREELNLLKRIDGKLTVSELCVNQDLDLNSSLKLIWTLFSLRMIGMAQTAESRKAEEDKKKKEEEARLATLKKSLAPQKEADDLPKAAPVSPENLRKEIEDRMKVYEKQNYFEILGIDRKDKPAKIKKVYFNLAKRYHPDVLTSMGLSDLVASAGAIFAKMTQAHDTLTTDELRKEYEATLEVDPDVIAKVNEIVQAEVEFQKGEALLRNRSYDAAHRQFLKALELNDEEAEHYVYIGWSEFLKNKGDKAMAAAGARKKIAQGLAMRSNIDMAHVFLARIARALGEVPEAEKQFNKALTINPGNDAAESELRTLLKKGK